MTDIIFIVDGCERSKACQASIKFFFESLKTSLCKEYIYIYIIFCVTTHRLNGYGRLMATFLTFLLLMQKN